MSNVPGFVYSEDLIAQANATEKWAHSQARKAKRSSRAGWAVALLEFMLIVLLVGVLDYAVPMIRLIPVFFYQDTNGLVQYALTTDSLPADLADANIKAWLFQYVSHRESYSAAEIDYNHYYVEAVSSKPVKDAYNAAVSGKNPDSYLAKYGDKAIVRVYRRQVLDFRPATKTAAGSITISFYRFLAKAGDNKKPTPEVWRVTMSFIQDYNRGLKLEDIESFNPSRIIVTDYPGAEPDTAPATLTTGTP